MTFYYAFVLALAATAHAQLSSEEDLTNPPSTYCTAANSYYKVDSSCDAYVECDNYNAKRLLCPDGLHFDLSARWPSYPCGYPVDVPCEGRGSVQPAQPTAECPHQYGYFPSPQASPNNCGQYRICVAGYAFEMTCPAGLAFNAATSSCDWPDVVPGCKAQDFLGFGCPAPPLDVYGNPINSTINYKYEGNCYYFFSCINGSARLLSCDDGLAFDPASGRCVDVEYVDCSH